jgi:hypothetical protein
MKLLQSFVLLLAIFSGGCTSVPTVMGICGSDSAPLNTREQVHAALGVPTATGTIDGLRFEEFQNNNGIDTLNWGDHVPAFQPLEDMHIFDADLRLMAVNDVNCIPNKGRNLIVVAAINHTLHFRLFDEDGVIVEDTDESKRPAQSGPIADLKRLLGNLWPDHALTGEENYQIIASVALIFARTPPGSFEVGMGTVKRFGPFVRIVDYPADDNLSRRRILSGQTLHFEFDESGKVTRVFVNGEFLLAPIGNSDSSSTDAHLTHGFVQIAYDPRGAAW